MRKVLLSRISFSALMLTFLTFIFLFFNFTSAGNWDKPLSGGGSFVYVNETQTNSSVYWGDLLSVHSTQFNKLAGILSLNTNWLENFIINVDKWDNYYTKTQSNNRYLQSESDPNYFNNPNQYYNSTTLPNIDLSPYYNKTEVNNILLNYYNETEVDSLINSLNSSFGDYYNKTEVDSLINGIPTPDLTIFYNKTEVDNLLNDYYPLSNPYGYLNESYDDSWINNTFYNQTQVDNLINGIDLSIYYTKTESDNTFVKLSNLVSLVGNWILDKPNYYNSTEVDDLINSIDYVNSSDLNSTQFETGEPVTIKTSWLTTFIESVSKWANYYTKSEIDNRYSNNTGDQDLSTYVQGNMSSETYNETKITPTTNYSLSFDGVNDYVDLGLDSSLEPISTASWCTWVKFRSEGGARYNQDHLINRWYAIGNFQVLTRYEWDNQKYGFWIYEADNNQVGGRFGSGIELPTVGNWYHTCFIANGTNLLVYVNGVPSTDIYSYDGTLDTGFSRGLIIGGRTVPDGVSGGNVDLDEVLIFNRSLNSTEISDLYNSGAGLYANTSIAPFNEGLVSGYHFDEGTGTTAYDITGRNNGTLVNGPTWVDGKISHNLTSTTETLGAKGLMPWASATNFISTDFSLQWIGNTLKNPWFTSTELGNSTNRWNIFAWDTETVNLNVTNQTTMNNLTVNNLNVTNSFTGNCVNASILNGIIVGCND